MLVNSWPDGRVYHVSLSDVTASRYEQQVTDVVRSCEKRLEWLQRGSRKTFGILTVHKVSLCIYVHLHTHHTRTSALTHAPHTHVYTYTHTTHAHDTHVHLANVF